jgi:nicotinamide-nucleotide adenylyltransferase
MAVDDLASTLVALREADRPSLVIPRAPPRPSRVGLLSGSFDPLTMGHTALAEAARSRVDLVVLSYSVRTLPKEAGSSEQLLPEGRRIRAVHRFCSSRPGFVLGLASHGLLSDQVSAVAGRFPDAEVFLIMGSDKIVQLIDPRWYEDAEAALSELFTRARVLYGVRTGDAPPIERVLEDPIAGRWAGRFERLPIRADAGAISSRLVRARYRRGEDIHDLVPPEVLEEMIG